MDVVQRGWPHTAGRKVRNKGHWADRFKGTEKLQDVVSGETQLTLDIS